MTMNVVYFQDLHPQTSATTEVLQLQGDYPVSNSSFVFEFLLNSFIVHSAFLITSQLKDSVKDSIPSPLLSQGRFWKTHFPAFQTMILEREWPSTQRKEVKSFKVKKDYRTDVTSQLVIDFLKCHLNVLQKTSTFAKFGEFKRPWQIKATCFVATVLYAFKSSCRDVSKELVDLNLRGNDQI